MFLLQFMYEVDDISWECGTRWHTEVAGVHHYALHSDFVSHAVLR
jgi:hypothetical protein